MNQEQLTKYIYEGKRPDTKLKIVRLMKEGEYLILEMPDGKFFKIRIGLPYHLKERDLIRCKKVQWTWENILTDNKYLMAQYGLEEVKPTKKVAGII